MIDLNWCAKAAGGKSAASPDGEGYFVAPTVLVDVPAGAECAREEIFGPVVTVETFTDEDEALTRANDTPYGLAASVWTSDARRGHDIASKLEAGTVWVNAHLVLASERVISAPMSILRQRLTDRNAAFGQL